MIKKFKQWRQKRIEKKINALEYSVTFYSTRANLSDFELKDINKKRDKLDELQILYQARYGYYYNGDRT